MTVFPLPVPEPAPVTPARPAVPPHVEAAVWRGTELGVQTTEVISSGWEDFDRELPSAGWPCQSISEILTAQPSVVEWRLLGPALRRIVSGGGQLAVVAPPRHPYLPGLIHDGFDERRFVWIQADGPAERLWATEQLIKSGACGAIVAWLPQARQEQIRRLQVCAQSVTGPVFLCRPEAARHEASAAPLRVLATFGLDWELHVHILKRRGPASDQLLQLPSVPGGLASVITPRLRQPSWLVSREVPADAVGRTALPVAERRRAAAL
jgi:protein ImuA